MEHFELVEVSLKYRIYKCDEELFLDVDGEVLERPPVEPKGDKMQIGWLDEHIAQPTRFFAVSDARTHIERILFPVYYAEDIPELGRLEEAWRNKYLFGVKCGGATTMMIDGGDPTTIRKDEEYLMEIWEANHNVEDLQELPL